jgi:hypothetical protein
MIYLLRQIFGCKFLKRKDARVIEGFEFNPNAKILFEVLKGYLYWDDEIIFGRGLSKHGYYRLTDLLLARCLLYHDPNRKIYNRDYYIKIWELASMQIINWTGFRSERLKLSQEEWDFYQYGLDNP